MTNYELYYLQVEHPGESVSIYIKLQ